MTPEVALVLALAAGPALAQAPSVSPPDPQQAPAAPAPPAWESRATIDLLVLDKVSAHATALSGPVGKSLAFGPLTITARACDVRPADAAPDATAFLDIVDHRAGVPDFHAWVLKSDPSVSVYEHPVYDVRLAGCR
jgi:hypothetical protein